eukprot:GHVQ01029875.1.p1 GENE.GHVQ01029875.1~~GHVQ01029875.1.p1  ORF type:complete len:104 (+),score=5.68 GHVQ01029875.1:1025-1336(+)
MNHNVHHWSAGVCVSVSAKPHVHCWQHIHTVTRTNIQTEKPQLPVDTHINNYIINNHPRQFECIYKQCNDIRLRIYLVHIQRTSYDDFQSNNSQSYNFLDTDT